ncbi:50S ribosomal protein L24 [Candidatus Woesearchaeota archaeon]|nr:50S ribosomal protein L24 [Candidatus Woesearchaeota archaeon]
MNAHTKGKKKTSRLKIGMNVKIMRGKHKGKQAKISRMNIKNQKVYLENIETTRRDGAKSQTPIHNSNIMILEEK